MDRNSVFGYQLSVISDHVRVLLESVAKKTKISGIQNVVKKYLEGFFRRDFFKTTSAQ